jgi:hypothetical protein
MLYEEVIILAYTPHGLNARHKSKVSVVEHSYRLPGELSEFVLKLEEGFSGASFQKFRTMEEAQAFVDQGPAQPSGSTSAGNSGVQKTKPELGTLKASGRPGDSQATSGASRAGGSNHERNSNTAGMHRDIRAPKRFGSAKQRSKALTRAAANEKADLVDDGSDKTTRVICTDGACTNNGKWNAVAGIGEPNSFV